MATTPEGKIKKKVKDLVAKTENCYLFMPVQAGYGAATLDFLGCHLGRFFAIETKAPGKKMTPRQEVVAQQIGEAGSPVFVIDGDVSLRKFEIWIIVGEIEHFIEKGPERAKAARRRQEELLSAPLSDAEYERLRGILDGED